MMFMSPAAATERFSMPGPYSTLREIMRFDSEKLATVSGCGCEICRLAVTESGVLVRLPLTSIVVPNIEKPPAKLTESVFVAVFSPTVMMVFWNEIAPPVPGIEKAPILRDALKIVGSSWSDAETSTVVPKTAPSNANDMPAGIVDVPTVQPSGATENSKYVAVRAPPPMSMIGVLPVDEPTAIARQGVASDRSAVIEIGTPLSTPNACISDGGRSPEAYNPSDGSGMGGSSVMPSEIARLSITSPSTPKALFQPVASWKSSVPLSAFVPISKEISKVSVGAVCEEPPSAVMLRSVVPPAETVSPVVLNWMSKKSELTASCEPPAGIECPPPKSILALKKPVSGSNWIVPSIMPSDPLVI